MRVVSLSIAASVAFAFAAAAQDSSSHRHDNDSNGNGIEDGSEYDRTPNGQISGPPNGAVSLSDVGVILNQVGDNCTAAPN